MPTARRPTDAEQLVRATNAKRLGARFRAIKHQEPGDIIIFACDAPFTS